MDKYDMGRVLGQGTFAKVHHARNRQTGESVAIKVIDKEKIVKIGLIEQMNREISVMRLVPHPNVVRIYEVMATRAKIYMVMEYARGGELFNKVARGRLKEEAARRYFQQLIAAVDFCHSRGVYHRDLKPENLLLDGSRNLKVSDFGLSALEESKREDGLLYTTCGTPAYVAPEVIHRKGYDGAKADVWSCGVILYVLLAGFLPFRDSNLMKLYRKIIKGDFRCPTWFPPQVRKLLSRILDPNPNTRITLSRIMEDRWFREGFWEQIQNKFPKHAAGDELSPRSVLDVEDDCDLNLTPTRVNAFDLISMSPGFDLSGLFRGRRLQEQETWFTTRESPSVVVSKLEKAAADRWFRVRKKEGVVRMEGSRGGRKGQLAIEAEIFEVAESVHMVELKKRAGDTIEYIKFRDEELRPSLNDVVWVWQGQTGVDTASQQPHNEEVSVQQQTPL